MCRCRHQSLSPTNLYANPTHEPKPQSERKKLKMLTRNRQRCRWMRWVCAREPGAMVFVKLSTWNPENSHIYRMFIHTWTHRRAWYDVVCMHSICACYKWRFRRRCLHSFAQKIARKWMRPHNSWRFFSYSFPLVRCAECWMLAAIQPRRLMLFVGGN